ncbi:DsbE family thiol:disulfide interchange protein [Telmatospirillum sp.]|uniref:DsbE family thiol:disulfide interchange protein n=1 Tax=Telmatospirillum sp. TaxID=2079197 RepID=UPI00284D74CA|nr:DsbE family thiol:disulfide interchange protein [Telmatospirillum sp.]MDR3440208.1 DsbE family thiol:disulfide interchange protein [Telmatospirillum sp.]
MMRRWPTFLPIGVFAVLVCFFAWRLVLITRGDAPNLIPSVMIDKPAPAFDLPPLVLDRPGATGAALTGKVTLINFFSSWCIPCRAEHPLLIDLMNRSEIKGRLVLMGIDYKDKPEDGRGWLNRLSNPYEVIGMDRDGRVGIDFGVYGVPESYLIDRQGRIRYKQVGPFTPEDIQGKLLPLLAELSK